jgi:hypothetical protein
MVPLDCRQHWNIKTRQNNQKCLNAFESREKMFTFSTTAALQAVNMRKRNAGTATRSLGRVIDILASFIVTKIEHS